METQSNTSSGAALADANFVPLTFDPYYPLELPPDFDGSPCTLSAAAARRIDDEVVRQLTKALEEQAREKERRRG